MCVCIYICVCRGVMVCVGEDEVRTLCRAENFAHYHSGKTLPISLPISLYKRPG